MRPVLLVLSLGLMGSLPAGLQPALGPLPAADDVAVIEQQVQRHLSGPRDQINSDDFDPGLAMEDYARYYSLISFQGDLYAGQLPFTTINASDEFEYPNRFIAGIYVHTDFIGEVPGVYRVKRHDLPEAHHGGCEVLNVVYDLDQRVLAAVYCNIN